MYMIGVHPQGIEHQPAPFFHASRDDFVMLFPYPERDRSDHPQP
jgi:hypothetical protein